MASRKVHANQEPVVAARAADGGPMCAVCSGRARQYLDELVEKLKALPQVKQVLIDWSAGIPHTWVVIDAPRMDETYRDPVILAEIEVGDRYPDVIADLHLANIVEHGVEEMPMILPAGAQVAFNR